MTALNRHRIEQVFWVVMGQGLGAIGTLLGVRLLTQFLVPAQYGVVTLIMGLSVLATNLVSVPLTQAAIHFYPRYSSDAGMYALRDSLVRGFRRFAPAVAIAAMVGTVWYVGVRGGSPLAVVALLLLIGAECIRSTNLSLLNAARRQREYAIWNAADAWLRPLAATAAVILLGQSPVVVIGAYVLVAYVLILTLSRSTWPRHRPAPTPTTAPEGRNLDRLIWLYATPLIPLGIITWAGGLGDRYIVGGVLGVQDAGLYAAIYGLASSPFLVVNGAVEQALRPVFQAAVSTGNREHARRLQWLWFGATGVVAGLGVTVFALGHTLISHWLVSPQYRQASSLMPWIALGYGIRCISYVFERICYAYGHTWRVLVIQVAGVAAAALVTPLGVIYYGLMGAACAAPVYFSVQCLVAVILARQTLRQSSDFGREVPAVAGATS